MQFLNNNKNVSQNEKGGGSTANHLEANFAVPVVKQHRDVEMLLSHLWQSSSYMVDASADDSGNFRSICVILMLEVEYSTQEHCSPCNVLFRESEDDPYQH